MKALSYNPRTNKRINNRTHTATEFVLPFTLHVTFPISVSSSLVQCLLEFPLYVSRIQQLFILQLCKFKWVQTRNNFCSWTCDQYHSTSFLAKRRCDICCRSGNTSDLCSGDVQFTSWLIQLDCYEVFCTYIHQRFRVFMNVRPALPHKYWDRTINWAMTISLPSSHSILYSLRCWLRC
jgi:hypothetical protein